MNAARRARIAGLLDRLEAMADDLREIDKAETAAWKATSVPLRSEADGIAFDSVGDASHYFKRLVEALTKAKEQPGND